MGVLGAGRESDMGVLGAGRECVLRPTRVRRQNAAAASQRSSRALSPYTVSASGERLP